jgi:hypothetical protein
VIPPSVGGDSSIRIYFELFDHNITLIAGAAEQLRGLRQETP